MEHLQIGEGARCAGVDGGGEFGEDAKRPQRRRHRPRLRHPHPGGLQSETHMICIRPAAATKGEEIWQNGHVGMQTAADLVNGLRNDTHVVMKMKTRKCQVIRYEWNAKRRSHCLRHAAVRAIAALGSSTLRKQHCARMLTLRL